jgi:Fe-S cluster assembly scaffold protein SufB
MLQGSSATVWSHCLFTEVREAVHAMDANVRLEAGARLQYQEVHYHGVSGGIQVLPRSHVTLGAGARYTADFTLVQGRVGLLDVDFSVDVGDRAVAELTSKVYGFGSDVIRIRETIQLNGTDARGLVKTRIAAREDATAEIRGATFGNAPGARGHVDCTEIVRDRAVVSAIPEVKVTNPFAKVTHEAAIGSVDARQLETLMARGLAPDAAIDLIIRGLLS